MESSRRNFLRAFTAASVGMVAAEKIGFYQEFLKWWTGPAKTIFIPPVAQVANALWAPPDVGVGGWTNFGYIIQINVIYDESKKMWVAAASDVEDDKLVVPILQKASVFPERT